MGWLTSAAMRACCKAVPPHPRGAARPVNAMETGISKAATVPPAANSSHQNGSEDLRIDQVPTTSHTIRIDTATQAATLAATIVAAGTRRSRSLITTVIGVSWSHVTLW